MEALETLRCFWAALVRGSPSAETSSSGVVPTGPVIGTIGSLPAGPSPAVIGTSTDRPGVTTEEDSPSVPLVVASGGDLPHTPEPGRTAGRVVWEFEWKGHYSAYDGDCQDYMERKYQEFQSGSGRNRVNVRTKGIQISVDFQKMTSKRDGSDHIQKIRQGQGDEGEPGLIDAMSIDLLTNPWVEQEPCREEDPRFRAGKQTLLCRSFPQLPRRRPSRGEVNSSKYLAAEEAILHAEGATQSSSVQWDDVWIEERRWPTRPVRLDRR
eukprot:g19815.t1